MIQNLWVVVVFPVKSGVRSFEVDWTIASHRSGIVGMIERFGTIYKDEGLKQWQVRESWNEMNNEDGDIVKSGKQRKLWVRGWERLIILFWFKKIEEWLKSAAHEHRGFYLCP